MEVLFTKKKKKSCHNYAPLSIFNSAPLKNNSLKDKNKNKSII